ncbi:hypothetical protein [Sphingomonas sp. NFR15]|uniref:hypothetical protein n=1 Tax=Sphingomonas sp. NFR15 TaxID=1566282 RepID=UPI00088BB73E|nr:hypothetical protein [Sphingomonas sp. NFR15]SDA20626.1 hypothetical protein SAMN03159340_01288 [Sphingomonas sp. NFR15]
MTLFELVKVALDELYDEGKAQHGASLDDKIKAKISYLAGGYRGLTDSSRRAISYRDPATRFAYVMKYVATHGDYVVQTLEALRDVNGGKVFSAESARLSCVGGGPGSDVMGVLKYLSENKKEPVKKLTCYLLDGEQAWADTWTEIGDALQSPVSINVNFQPLDVTKPESWNSQKKFLLADLFTFSYFVSEVKAFDKGGVVGDFWDKIFTEASIGANFLYIDNGYKEFNEFFDSFWRGRKDVECLYEDDNQWTTPRGSEQSDELGEYKTKFGQSPKLKSMISTRILKKIK